MIGFFIFYGMKRGTNKAFFLNNEESVQKRGSGTSKSSFGTWNIFA